MPIYCFKCINVRCCHEFEEIKSIKDCDQLVTCHKCGSMAYKTPALFVFNEFKPRKFSDGTESPQHVSTSNQEKVWLKTEGITLDAPSSDRKRILKEERRKKSKKVMDDAFLDAFKKCEHGFKIEGVKQREVKGELTKLA